MEQLFKAQDGKIFANEKQCKDYETGLSEKENNRKQMHEDVEKAKRDYLEKKASAEKSYKSYIEILSKFNDKYGVYHTNITARELSELLFDFPFGRF